VSLVLFLAKPASAETKHNLSFRSPSQTESYAVSHQYGHALHQQPGRTQRTYDEGQAENLSRLSMPDGATDVANLRSSSTPSKQHWNVVQAIAQDPKS
jgi:hypothetical protein